MCIWYLLMSSVQLRNYLKKIEENGLINYPKFLKLVQGLNLPFEISKQTITARKIKGDSYKVQVVSPELNDALQKIANLNSKSRASLATQNRSHATKVSGSIMVCRKENQHPYVISFDSYGYVHKPEDYVLSSICLVIENLENFLQIEKTLEGLKRLMPNSSDAVEVIWADGLAVANSLHKAYFSQFNEIVLFLDLDLGGLNIAVALQKIVPNIPINFIVLPETVEVLANVVEMETAQVLKQVEDLGVENSFLRHAAQLICKHRKTIEQEAFLHE